MDQHTAFLTFVVSSIPLGVFCASFSHTDEYVFYVLTFYTQLLCLLNFFVAHKYFQIILHDIFVYLLVYGLTHTNCLHTKFFACTIALTMLGTRHAYKRCIFLWWNEERNLDNDLITLFLVGICCYRTLSLLTNSMCILVALTSHFLEDSLHNSFAKRFTNDVKHFKDW